MSNIGTHLTAESVLEATVRELVSGWRQLFSKTKAQSANFGERLRLLRRRLGFTQAQLGAHNELTPTAVAELELGVRLPTSHDLHAIASVLNVPIDRLLEDRIEH